MSEAIIGLLGVILGGTLAVSKDLVAYIVKRKHNGRYAAVRIISMLYEYAQKCVAVVFDDGTLQGRPAGRTEHGEEFYDPQIACPEPPIFPDDIDWRSISFKLMYRILALPNTARETDRYITASAEHAFPPDYDELFVARQEGYASLGLEALDLVEQLRQEFDLPAVPPKFWNPDWDARKFLTDKQVEFQSRRRIDTTASARMIEELESNKGHAQ